MHRVGAVVVSYHPEMPVLNALLQSLLCQVQFLVLVDNGGGERFLEEDAAARQQVHYLSLGENMGLGTALNHAFDLAVEAGLDYFVTFDQDSHADDSLISKLAECMGAALRRDPNCVAVGPHFFDRREGNKVSFPFYTSESGSITPAFATESPDGLLKVDTLITSGMMVSVPAWQAKGRYDEGMFVDYTDTEWCFRVRSRGGSLYGCLNVEMGHALSDAPPIKILGLSFFEYSPIRRYFYFRNTVAVIRMAHTPTLWKRRLAKGLLLRFFVNLMIDKHRVRSLRMMLRGVAHGLRCKLGGLH
ncbi:glycosyltransferase family 2 protein [Pseudomonas sp. NPDC090592]|uniref:glycosyltransferase family 2 protein n=1 Tax=Pseudomonas sp. NPDC090592 TaxID=3364480 RepID=UPI00383A0280